MNLHQWKIPNKRLAVLAVCAASVANGWSQEAPKATQTTTLPAKPATPATPTPAPVPPAPLKKEVEVSTPANGAEGDTIMLSPFEVVGDNRGYQAYNSASGTRLNSRLEDIASPISVVTKQQLQDMAAVDLNDIFRSESNVEGLYQYSEGFDDGRGFVDVASNNPEANNRIRGMGQSNITQNGMSVSSIVPIDSYNIDSLEINRGANSTIFGIGSTSGTVNLNVSTGNMTRDLSKVSFMTDNLGRVRGTVDFNRVLIRNKLALRVLGANDKLGFVREPASSRTKRFTVAMRAQPFKKTSIKASYETYRVSESLANRFTPKDGITPWQEQGSYTWNPNTFTLYDRNNNPVGTFLGTRLGTNTTATSIFNPNTGALVTNGTIGLRTFGFINGPGAFADGGDSGLNRPTIGYIGGQVSYFTFSHSYRFNRRLTGGTNPPEGTNEYINNGDMRTVQYSVPGVQIYVPDINPATGQPFGYFSTEFRDAMEPLHTEADKAIYDWEKVNLNASNRAEKQSNISRFELEQYILQTSDHQLAFQLGGLYEDVENKSWNFIGNGGDGPDALLYIDANRVLPDGSPNPGYLRPHLQGRQPQMYYRPEKNFTHKAQLAYQADFSKNDGWSKWAGRHNFVAYAEERERRYAPGALRYRTQLANVDGTINHSPGNRDSLNTRYYMGDASGFNVDASYTSPPSAGVFPYTYWSTEFGPTGAVTTAPAQFRTAPGTLAEIFFNGNTQKHEIRSRGLIWQGFLLKDRIIPTIGYRKDKSRFVNGNSLASPAGTNGYMIGSATYYDPTHSLFDMGTTYTITDPLAGRDERVGRTRTQGVVVKPLKGFTKSSFLDGISLTYNKSDSFQPSDLAVDTYGDIIDDPRGQSEDYGVRFSLLNERLYVSVNKYKGTTINARNNGATAINNRAIGFDRDVTDNDAEVSYGGISSGTQLDLFDWYFFRIYGQTSTVAGQPAGTIPPPFFVGTSGRTGDPVYAAQNGLIGATDAATLQNVTNHVFQLMQYDKDLVRKYAQAGTKSSTNDVTSKGYELEILYRTKNWNLKITGAKQQTIDSNLATSLGKYINEREPVLRAASYTNRTDGTPTESYWRTTYASSGSATREDFWLGSVRGNYNVLVANLGKPRTQVREYSTALTTSYNLAGISSNEIVKSIRVGGGVNWTSKASIGYGYSLPELNPETNQYRIYGYDTNKAYYDKARYTANVWMAYDFRMFAGRIKSSVQLNVQNLLEEGRLQRTKVRGDGVGVYYRIVDPRLYQLTLNMEL